MAKLARLITPQGKTIRLSDEIYRQIKGLLAAHSRRQSRAKVDKAIQAGYGKYAGDTSMTQALLAERAADRAREEADFRPSHA